MVEVGGVARAPGNFLNAINQRNAAADEFAVYVRISGHELPPAAACTDSMIFT